MEGDRTVAEPKINEDREQHRPDQQLAAVLIDLQAVRGVVTDLEQLGMDVADVRVLHGPDGIRVFDLEGEHQGWWAHIVRSFKNVGGADANVLANYNEALQDGQALVLVPMVEGHSRDEIVDIIRRHGGAQINYWEAGGMETIG